MEMLLMVAAMSLLGVAVSSMMFAAATRDESAERTQPEARPFETLAVLPSQFFAHDTAPAAAAAAGPGVPPHAGVPIEVLLMQIQRHVTLERAAAESFLDAPTAQSLHSRTMSPLVH
jgi:hypothetical protein